MNELIQFSFTKKELAKIHPTHLSYILTAGHAINELNAFRIFQIFEDLRNFDNQPERSFIAVRQAVIMRHMIAKSYEFNELTNKYLGEIKKIFPKFAATQRSKFAIIAKEIHSRKWMSALRNKLAFHFDASNILNQFNKIADHQKLTLISGSNSINCAHLFCEETAFFPFIHDHIDKNIENGLHEMIGFSRHLTHSIIEYYIELTTSIFQTYGILQTGTPVAVNRASIGSKGESFIPIFVDDETVLWTPGKQ